MKPDVTECRSAEQCVAQGMYYHIAVGVGDAAFLMFDFDASQYEGQPLSEGVYVVSVSDSELHDVVPNFEQKYEKYGNHGDV